MWVGVAAVVRVDVLDEGRVAPGPGCQEVRARARGRGDIKDVWWHGGMVRHDEKSRS